tara:strand:- start:381 stop:653 length:273 start_codon:yes stop_codon:yes gene_type:complete
MGENNEINLDDISLDDLFKARVILWKDETDFNYMQIILSSIMKLNKEEAKSIVEEIKQKEKFLLKESEDIHALKLLHSLLIDGGLTVTLE